jgi:hypothetical protein
MVWVAPGVVKVLEGSKIFEDTLRPPAGKSRVNHLYAYRS